MTAILEFSHVLCACHTAQESYWPYLVLFVCCPLGLSAWCLSLGPWDSEDKAAFLGIIKVKTLLYSGSFGFYFLLPVIKAFVNKMMEFKELQPSLSFILGLKGQQ